MKKVYHNTNLTCFFQDSELKANQSLTGDIALTSDGFRFEEEFHETKPHTHNPKIFNGSYISLVRKQDNTIQFNFRTINKNTNLSKYADDVRKEIKNALKKLQ